MPIARGLVCALLLLPGAGCIPGKGTATIYGEAGPDHGGAGGDHGVTGDRGPTADTPPGPRPDGAPPPKPDTQPASPQPPFGTSVGMTAANVSGIPNCDSSLLFELHSYYKKTRGVVLPIMSPT